MQIVGTTVAVVGGAAVATGIGAPAGAAAVLIGGVWALEGLALSTIADEDDCATIAHYDGGFYHETGTFVSYWGDYGWLGQGFNLVNGLVNVYGTVEQPVLAEYFETIPYDNAPAIEDWYTGVDTATSARTNAYNAANGNLPQFGTEEGILGAAWITIEILCAGYGEIFQLSDPDAAAPLLHEESAICLTVEVGAASTGTVTGSGYGEIEIHADGVADSGYVEVNGDPVVTNGPVVVNMDGEGVNVPESS